MIYKFVNHPITHEDAPPAHTMFDLYRRVARGGRLTRAEKNQIVRALYGTFGSGATFKLGGWAAPFQRVLPRFWVKMRHGQIREFFAPDKTSLRSESSERHQMLNIVTVA